MSYGWAKSIFLLAVGILAWMLLLAFRPSAPLPMRGESLANIPLSKEDLALLPPSLQGTANAPAATNLNVSPTPTGRLPGVEHSEHQKIIATLPPIRRRTIDPHAPLTVDGLGRGQLDWDILAATTVSKRFDPQFPKSLAAVDGKPVAMTGFMAPLSETGAMHEFLLLEFPVGCFYCLAPQPTGIVHVVMAAGQETSMQYEPVRITGTLRLNRDDPEDFVYSILSAKISAAD